MRSVWYMSAVLVLATNFVVAAKVGAAEENAAFWYQDAQVQLDEAKKLRPNKRQARNVILFVGDGMGISTITAARILQGQMQGRDGERNQLAFERLPYLALSKTYSANQQTPDSAPTMTAIVAGVKTNDGMFGVDAGVKRGEPNAAVLKAHQVMSLLELAEQRGLATGIVSTARITHATPGATFAHTSERDWERDTQLPVGASVQDIAAQLVDNYGAGKVGDGVEVVLGGGRREFLPVSIKDPEDSQLTGLRGDDRHLVNEFVQRFNAQFVWNQADFDAFDPASGKRLLGLFAPSHMAYEQDRLKDSGGEPSLAQMTAKAIQILQQKKYRHGYFLMVEAGRIDHGHHAGNAYRALTETIALSDAVETAMHMTNPNETLMIVTADHSHVFTIAGYAKRGNPILGKVINPDQSTYALAEDGMPYTTLSYANGKGYHVKVAGDDVTKLPAVSGRPQNMTLVDTTDPDFHQQALVPLPAETHAGEDVAIFAGGPGAYLFHGVREQNYIFQVMKFALRL